MLQFSGFRCLPDSEGTHGEYRSQTNLRTANSADPGGGGRARVLPELSACEHGPRWSKWLRGPITGPIFRAGHQRRPRERCQERMSPASGGRKDCRSCTVALSRPTFHFWSSKIYSNNTVNSLHTLLARLLLLCLDISYTLQGAYCTCWLYRVLF